MLLRVISIFSINVTNRVFRLSLPQNNYFFSKQLFLEIDIFGTFTIYIVKQIENQQTVVIPVAICNTCNIN